MLETWMNEWASTACPCTAPLFIGNGAPVAAESIYFPRLIAHTDHLGLVSWLKIQAPTAYRAVGIVEVTNSSTQDLISTTKPPKVLVDLRDGEKVIEMEYNYDISALDFGLQKFDGLSLNVTGSCRTEYGWYTQENELNFNTESATNNIWNVNSSTWVSELDGWAPRAFFY